MAIIISRRFYCPTCNCVHALGKAAHLLRTIAPEGKLFCAACGEIWHVAIQPSGVAPRVGDEVCAWLLNHMEKDAHHRDLIIGLVEDYRLHAEQRISLEEPTGK